MEGKSKDIYVKCRGNKHEENKYEEYSREEASMKKKLKRGNKCEENK